MKLNLKNIGLIKECDIDINGITVIAGSNNTGKSTIGKTLHIIFNTAHQIENKIVEERRDALTKIIIKKLNSFVFEEMFVEMNDIIDNILKNKNKYIENNKLLYDRLKPLIYKEDKKSSDEIVNMFIEILELADDEFINFAFYRQLYEDFEGNITNIYKDDNGQINLYIKDQIINIQINSKREVDVVLPKNLSLQTEILYIDDPFVLDQIGGRKYDYPSFLNRNDELLSKIKSKGTSNYFEQLLANKKMTKIEKIINGVCEGVLVEENGKFVYKHGNKTLGIYNLSAGLKAFAILKTLLLNGSITYNGTIILDEPEIHLHPEWQIIYAELIVLLQKEFNLHILINTHSPYFIDALYIYSKKYKISERNKYYLTKLEDKQTILCDVTNNEQTIYKKLAKPFQDLENLRSEIDD